MKCPFCQKEMRNGRLESGRLTAWTPNDSPTVLGFRTEKSVTLGNPLFGCSLPAAYCPDCGQMVVTVKKD